MKQSIYYMVHCVNGSGSPNMKHPTYKEAVREAKRLATGAPNSSFTVLRVIDCYMKPSDGAHRIQLDEGRDDCDDLGPMDF